MKHRMTKGMLLCTLALLLCIILCILFQTPYLGAADNGDFGRIGTRIGIHGMLNWEANDRSVFWSYVREE